MPNTQWKNTKAESTVEERPFEGRVSNRKINRALASVVVLLRR
jgi:hypothetical protein